MLDVDDYRDAQGMTWTEIARETAVDEVTIKNLAIKSVPTADEFLRLIIWLNADARLYVTE